MSKITQNMAPMESPQLQKISIPLPLVYRQPTQWSDVVAIILPRNAIYWNFYPLGSSGMTHLFTEPIILHQIPEKFKERKPNR